MSISFPSDFYRFSIRIYLIQLNRISMDSIDLRWMHMGMSIGLPQGVHKLFQDFDGCVYKVSIDAYRISVG